MSSVPHWLVVWNMVFSHFIYGMSSFPLTNSIIFQDGLLTTNQLNFLYSKEISSAGFCLDEPPYAGNGVFFFLPEDQNKTRWRCRFSWQFFRCYPLVNIKKNCGKSWKIRIFDGINYFDWAIFKFANCKRLPGRVIYPTEDVAHIF